MSQSQFHLIGIGGIGMSALAHILNEKQYQVSGSDSKENRLTRALAERGVAISYSQSADNIQSPSTTVVYSTAIHPSNPELVYAKSLGCRLWHRSELLAYLMKSQESIAVSGTHGKTTTSALLAHVLVECQQSPTYVIGGVLNTEKSNAKIGKGRFFVAEADESDKSFLHYSPNHAILTNVEADHLDHYKNLEEIESSFTQFCSQVNDTIVWCCDCPKLRQMAPKGISYGFHEQAEAQLTSFVQKGREASFNLTYNNVTYESIEVPMMGKHNVLNAAAVFMMLLKLGLNPQDIKRAIKSFGGVGRRAQKLIEKNQVQIFDDYAHHPTEVEHTLKGFRSSFPKRRLIAIFQPHRYSRLIAFKEDFEKAFSEADEVWLCDVYGAGETPPAGFDISKMAQDIQEHSQTVAHYVTKDRKIELFRKMVKPFDLFITLGAGDISAFAHEMTQELEKLEPKLKVALIDGGTSYEHYISLISSKYVEKNYPKNLIELSRFHIQPGGVWTEYDEQTQTYHSKDIFDVLQKFKEADVVFPVFHGGLGEGGGFQGLLETLGIPFCGPSHSQSSFAMNKIWMQQFVKELGIQTTNSLFLSKREWKQSRKNKLQFLADSLCYPMVVKPASLGSTIGITFVNNLHELENAIDQVFTMDEQVIIENKVQGIDLEVACINTEDGVIVAHPGQVKSDLRHYDYVAKYSKNPIEKAVRAEIDSSVAQKCEQLARKIYEALGLTSYSRIDFFLTTDQELIFAEVNTLPGMTPRSLFQRMLEAHGLKPETILSEMILSALFDHRIDRKRQAHIQQYLKQIKDVTHA